MWGSFYLLTVFAISCRVDALSKRFIQLQEADEIGHPLPEVGVPPHERSADPDAFNNQNSLFRPQISPRFNPTQRPESVATSATPQAPPTSGGLRDIRGTVVANSTQGPSSHFATLVAEDLKLGTTQHAQTSITQTTSAPATASPNVFSGPPIFTGSANVPTATSSVFGTAVRSHIPSATKENLPPRGFTVGSHSLPAADDVLKGTTEFPKRRAAPGNSSSSAISTSPVVSIIATSSTLVDTTLKPSLAPAASTASTISGSTSIATVGASNSPTTPTTRSPESKHPTTRRPVPTSTSARAPVGTLGNMGHRVPPQPRVVVPPEPTAPVSPLPATPTAKSHESEPKTTRQPVPTSKSAAVLPSTGKNLGHPAPTPDPAEAPTEQTVLVSLPTTPTTPKSEATTSRQPVPTSTSATVLVGTGENLEHPAPPNPPAVVPTEPAVPVPSQPPQPVPTEPTPPRPTEPAQPVPPAPAVPSQEPTEPPLPAIPTEPVIPTLPVVPTEPPVHPKLPTVPPQPVEPAVPPRPLVPSQVVTDGYIRTIIQHDTDYFVPFVPHKTIEDLVFDQDDHLKQGSCGKCQRKLHYCVQKCFTHHSCEAEQIMTCPRIVAPCFGPFKKEHDQCQVTADCEGVHHLCCLVGCSRRCVPGLLVPIEAHP